MSKARLALMISVLTLFTGCSRQDWLSKYYMFKAENAVSDAAIMKDRKVEYEKRVPLYASACRYFRQAYETDNRVFTLNRIEEASDSCWRANDRETEDLFKAFEEEYSKKHPQEVEHGDSGVGMMEMG